MNREPSESTQATPIRLSRSAVAASALIALVVLAGLVPRWHHRAALEKETQELAVPSVRVVSPTADKGEAGPWLPADVKPWIEAPIYARASGYLKRWLADLGSAVQAGQLLAEIETPELDQDLERARQQLAEAEAALDLAKITSDRYTELLKTHSVSEQETAEKQAELALKTARVASVRADVRRLETLQAFARVTAPFAGVITLRNVDVGDLITAGAGKELFRLAQTEKLRVYVRVPQTLALSVAPGQPAELLLPERPNRIFRALVASTAGVISADSRTLLAQLEVENPRGEILAGSFTQVRFPASEQMRHLSLPGNTLLFRPEGPQVGVVRPDGKVELRSVKLGRDFGRTVEILDGVAPEDRVILNPSDSLENGATVRIDQTAKAETAP